MGPDHDQLVTRDTNHSVLTTLLERLAIGGEASVHLALEIERLVDNIVPAVLLGDGDSRASLEDYTQHLSSKSAIEYLGFCNDRLTLLRDFDLFVMTSTLEGIPRCLMEACAMEIPVSAYDIAGIDQLITHKESGLLAPLNDSEQLMQDWQTMLDESEYARELASNAREFVQEHFSAQRMADEYYELFGQVVKEAANA